MDRSTPRAPRPAPLRGAERARCGVLGPRRRARGARHRRARDPAKAQTLRTRRPRARTHAGELVTELGRGGEITHACQLRERCVHRALLARQRPRVVERAERCLQRQAPKRGLDPRRAERVRSCPLLARARDRRRLAIEVERREARGGLHMLAEGPHRLVEIGERHGRRSAVGKSCERLPEGRCALLELMSAGRARFPRLASGGSIAKVRAYRPGQCLESFARLGERRLARSLQGVDCGGKGVGGLRRACVGCRVGARPGLPARSRTERGRGRQRRCWCSSPRAATARSATVPSPRRRRARTRRRFARSRDGGEESSAARRTNHGDEVLRPLERGAAASCDGVGGTFPLVQTDCSSAGDAEAPR